MARNVFLSILGNGFYKECSYYWETKENHSKQRFVQKACVDLFCTNWKEDDIIILFLTESAKRKIGIKQLLNEKIGTRKKKII